MTPVKQVALEQGLPVYQPEKLSGSKEMSELMTLMQMVVTAAFGQFLPMKLINSLDFAINVHASLLPKYRGGAPIHYAIINGDKEAGVTIMEMVQKWMQEIWSPVLQLLSWMKTMLELCLKS